MAYLDLLAPDEHGFLVVVAPEARFETLWPELLSRLDGAQRDYREINARAVEVEGRRRLLLVSWRSILNSMRLDLEAAGERQLAADVAQLEGLAHRMDTDAFLPLQSGELDAALGRRVAHVIDLIGRVVDRARTRGIADTNRLSTGGGEGAYGRYFRFFNDAGWTAFLVFHPRVWAAHGAPLLLQVGSNTGRYLESASAAREQFAPLERSGDFQVLEVEGQGVFVPLTLLTGAERDDVIDHLVDQLRRISLCLQGEAGTNSQESTP